MKTEGRRGGGGERGEQGHTAVHLLQLEKDSKAKSIHTSLSQVVLLVLTVGTHRSARELLYIHPHP